MPIVELEFSRPCHVEQAERTHPAAVDAARPVIADRTRDALRRRSGAKLDPSRMSKTKSRTKKSRPPATKTTPKRARSSPAAEKAIIPLAPVALAAPPPVA